MKLAEIRPLPEWEKIVSERLGKTVLVIGAADSGKTTLVRWLADRLVAERGPVAWIDADIGQSTFGVPTTMNLALLVAPSAGLPAPTATFFVGGTSPRGHMLPALVGVERLRQRGESHGAALMLIDTSGHVSEAAGGGALKEWKIELLRPSTIIALQRERELEHLLGPLRRRRGLVLHDLSPVPQIRRRSPEARAARRRARFRTYFADARPLRLAISRLPIYGLRKGIPGRLLAFLDHAGFSPALGILLDHAGGGMEILTPLANTEGIAALRFGDLKIDAETGEEGDG